MPDIAILGGTGLSSLKGLKVLERLALTTDQGAPSDAVIIGELRGRKLAFLPRHGHPHRLPPHLINYRANIRVLHDLLVKRVIAVNAVGGVRAGLAVGDLVINDQLIDYTYGREHTFFTDRAQHIDFTYPYDAELRRLLAECGEEAGRRLGFRCHASGCCGVTQGPRLETAAEIRRLARDGVDVVGMTGMPEAALAAELEMRYASISMVVNPAAGLDDSPVDLAALDAAVEKSAAHARALLELALERLP